MGGGNALEVLDHYKNKIMRYTEDEGVLLHCLGKLDMVKVTIPLLQDTMIGKTVGLVKKKYGESDVGIKAKALVAKWKEVVRQEEIAQEKAREEEEKARGSQSADESPEQSADRSPDQSADRSPGGGSADQEDDTNDEPPEYIPTPVVPAYIPTPINKLQAQEPGASSDTLHRKSHKHKKSSRERETEDEIKKEETRREREERKEREHKRDKEKKDLSSSEHKDKSRDHKSSRSHKEKERDKEREEERRKEKRRRDENELKHRHTSRVEADSGGERERGSGGESGATIKIKEEGGGSIRIKEEGGGSSSRAPKPEKDGAGRHKDSASIRIKEEGGGSTRAKDEGRSKHRSEEERRKHSHSKEYSSSSRKIKEEYTEDSQGVKSSSQLNCDKVESAVQHVSGSQQNGDTNDSRKRESSSSKHKKDKHRSDRHKDKHRESRKDKPEKSSETKKSKPAEYMELDIFSQLPLDNNIKDKSRKRHRQEDVPSEGELSEKRKKLETNKGRTESPLDRSGSSYTPSSAAVLSTPQFASLPVAGLSGANSGLSLPEISPLYKPLPRPPIQSRHMVSEEEALDALMGKKGSRSAVYSGKKRQRFFGEVPSLYDQCIMVLQDHVDDIDEVGPLNYDILEPVLERAAPQTLIHIEDLNQHLMTGPTNTSKLWEKHCLREFRNKAREEMESWREMYERCTYEREQKLNQLKGKIKTTQTEAKDSMRKSKLAYPDAVPKPPREVASKQAKHGTGLPTGTVLKVGAVVRPKVSDPTAGQASRPSAPKKNKVPPMMQKAKSMMKGMSRFGRR